MILKYYEEDIRRLKSQKQSLKNDYLIDMVLEERNFHRILAERVVEDVMYGSVADIYKFLNDTIGMNIQPSAKIEELFLIRNCFVHNDKRASIYLHRYMPSKYKKGRVIKITLDDIDRFRNSVSGSASFVAREYTRLFPTVNGTWHGETMY